MMNQKRKKKNMDLMNFNLKEEKKELQLQCNLLREQANEFHRIARENSALKKKKAEMDVEFEKNNIKKGDAKFQYDIRKEFDHEQYAAEWDDDSY